MSDTTSPDSDPGLPPTTDNSDAAYIADSKTKIYRNVKSQGKGWMYTSVFGETRCDFNTYGAEAVGGYFVASGYGTIGGTVNDIVGVSGTAHKRTNGWACGGHFDAFDYIPGGTLIGVNIELPKLLDGTNSIGLNVLVYDGQEADAGINLMGGMVVGLDTTAAKTKTAIRAGIGQAIMVGPFNLLYLTLAALACSVGSLAAVLLR